MAIFNCYVSSPEGKCIFKIKKNIEKDTGNSTLFVPKKTKGNTWATIFSQRAASAVHAKPLQPWCRSSGHSHGFFPVVPCVKKRVPREILWSMIFHIWNYMKLPCSGTMVYHNIPRTWWYHYHEFPMNSDLNPIKTHSNPMMIFPWKPECSN